LENWLEWKEKLIQVAKVEASTRPSIKRLLEQLPSCDEISSDGIVNHFKAINLC